MSKQQDFKTEIEAINEKMKNEKSYQSLNQANELYNKMIADGIMKKKENNLSRNGKIEQLRII